MIGVNSFRFKLVAFATSSFIGGVSGAILICTFYHAVTPEQFSVDVSIELLAMVIVGGLGSIIGSYFGAAFILLMPGQMNSFISWLATRFGLSLGIETLAPHSAGALRRADHRISADRADGTRQDLQQHPQLPAGLAVRLRQEIAEARDAMNAHRRCQDPVAQQRRGRLRLRLARDQGRFDRGARRRNGGAARRQRRRQKHDTEIDQRPAGGRARRGARAANCNSAARASAA